MTPTGTSEQRGRDGDAERLRGLEIDNELELRRLLYRKLARFFALQDAIRILSRAAAPAAFDLDVSTLYPT